MMAVYLGKSAFVFIIWILSTNYMLIQPVSGDVLPSVPKWLFQYHSTPRTPSPRWLNRQWTVKHSGFASYFIRVPSTDVSTLSFSTLSSKTYSPFPSPWSRALWMRPRLTQLGHFSRISVLPSTTQPSPNSKIPFSSYPTLTPLTSEGRSSFSEETTPATALITDTTFNIIASTKNGAVTSETSMLQRESTESSATQENPCFLTEESCRISHVAKLIQSAAIPRSSNLSHKGLEGRDIASTLTTLMTSPSSPAFNLDKENVSHLSRKADEMKSKVSNSSFKSPTEKQENRTNLLHVAFLITSGASKPDREVIPSHPVKSTANQASSPGKQNTKTPGTMPLYENDIASTDSPPRHQGVDSSITVHEKVVSLETSNSKHTLRASPTQGKHFPFSFMKFGGTLSLLREEAADVKQLGAHGTSTVLSEDALSQNGGNDATNKTASYDLHASKTLDRDAQGIQTSKQNLPNLLLGNKESHSLTLTNYTEKITKSSGNSSQPNVHLGAAGQKKQTIFNSSKPDIRKARLHIYFSYGRSDSTVGPSDSNRPVQKEMFWSAISKLSTLVASSKVSKNPTPVLNEYSKSPKESTIIYDNDIILPAPLKRISNHTRSDVVINGNPGRIKRDIGNILQQYNQGSVGQAWRSAPYPAAAARGEQLYHHPGHVEAAHGKVQGNSGKGLTKATEGTTTPVWFSTSTKRTESRLTEGSLPGKTTLSDKDDRQNRNSVTGLPSKNAERLSSSLGSHSGMFSLLRLRNNLDTVIKLIHLYEDFHKRHWASSTSLTTLPAATTTVSGSSQAKESTSGTEKTKNSDPNPSPRSQVPLIASDQPRSSHDKNSQGMPMTNNNNNRTIQRSFPYPYPESRNIPNNVENPKASYGGLYDGSREQQGPIGNNNRTSQNSLGYARRPPQPPAAQTLSQRLPISEASGGNAAVARGARLETDSGQMPGSKAPGFLNPGVPSAGGQQWTAPGCVDSAGGLIRPGSFRDIGTLDLACRCPSTLPATSRQGAYPSAACFRREDTCEWQGQLYTTGEWFSPLSCVQCVCEGGMPQCQEKKCPPVTCSSPVLDADGCCKSCRQGSADCLLPDGSVLIEGQKTYFKAQHWVQFCVCDPIAGNRPLPGPRRAVCR